MLRVTLIDDEQEGLDVLEYDINRLGMDIQILGKYNDPKIGLGAIREKNPDLVFLDIEMPWMNGFELLDQLEEIPFDVIFVTAYDQFAIKAFRYYAIDYLLKPVDQENLREAVARVSEKRKGISKTHLHALIDKLDKEQEPFTKLALPTLEGFEFIPIESIVRCEASNNYCNVILTSGKKFLVSRPLKYIQNLLEEHRFYRTHQSHLINLDHIARYVKSDGGYIVMSDNSIVNLSRGKKDGFLEFLNR